MSVLRPFIPILILCSASVVSPAETLLVLPPLPVHRIALTFDDGPRPVTAQLQQLLKRHDVKATFFVVGHMAARYKDLVRSLSSDGHEIAGHSWSHRDIRRMRPQEFKMELDLTRQLIRQITGEETWLFRAPGGTETFIEKKFIYPTDYTMVMWNVHSMDHMGLSSDQIVSRVEGGVEDGDIVLLHNGLPATMEALDLLIPHLKARGYQFVTVKELQS